MKKLLSVMAALTTALVMTAAYAEDFGSTAVLGDSIATGYGLSGYAAGDNASAAQSFGSLIAAQGGDYVNLAVDGRTSEELLSSLSEDEAANAVKAAQSVVVSIGGNDFLRPMLTAAQTALFSNSELLAALTSGTLDTSDPETAALLEQAMQSILAAAAQVDAESSADNLRAITAKIRELNPDCRLYLLTVYDPFEGAVGIDGLDAFITLAEEKLGVINGAVKSIAENDPNTAAVDVYSAFKGHAAEYTNILFWDIHPNAAGHSVIYSLLSESAAEPAAASPKGSPETGAAGVAAAAGALVAAGAALVICKKRAK